MTRGNQRDKAREKNMKEQAGKGKKNAQSGTEFQRTKEQQAEIMRQKQAKGGCRRHTIWKRGKATDDSTSRSKS
ncbi:hypothetical protein EDD37DRAFT_630531 [Exophiala viscosa]|uniref:uncharacterized protein n=1 Tax=Exophiala viscosa TaxID=2486360 RepID=UPI00219CF6D0|nr:hypothetical protein EDD37DRAFT_630531 [Exophiala viscosa]